jgi:hypothetical protein
MLTDVYWTDDVSQLWKHPLEFFPIQASRERRLNATTRLILYSSAIIAIVRKSILPVIAGIVLSIIAAVVFWRKKHRDVHILKHKKPGCRQPTLNNPAMNTPVADMGKKIRTPCASGAEMQEKYMDTYMYSDADDIYGNDIAVRPFIPLPNGGVYPDFSQLAETLAPTTSD